MEKLKPCPFNCTKGNPRLASFQSFFFVECPYCKARGPRTMTEDRACEVWNTRLPEGGDRG